MIDLSALFGPIDIYLFDQILRKRIAPGMRVFDALALPVREVKDVVWNSGRCGAGNG
jgi:hypothetical protein